MASSRKPRQRGKESPRHESRRRRTAAIRTTLRRVNIDLLLLKFNVTGLKISVGDGCGFRSAFTYRQEVRKPNWKVENIVMVSFTFGFMIFVGLESHLERKMYFYKDNRVSNFNHCITCHWLTVMPAKCHFSRRSILSIRMLFDSSTIFWRVVGGWSLYPKPDF